MTLHLFTEVVTLDINVGFEADFLKHLSSFQMLLMYTRSHKGLPSCMQGRHSNFPQAMDSFCTWARTTPAWFSTELDLLP